MKTANEVEKEFLLVLEKNYGHNLKSWMEVIAKSGLAKQKEIQAWLKKEKGFKHMEAWMLAAIYINGGKPIYGDEAELLDSQMAKYETMRPLFEYVSENILKAVEGSEREIKKTYVSFKKKREFAAVNIKKDEIRLGMDLGDHPFDESIQKAKLTGPMPRISHMAVIRNKSDFDQKIIKLLATSVQRIS